MDPNAYQQHMKPPGSHYYQQPYTVTPMGLPPEASQSSVVHMDPMPGPSGSTAMPSSKTEANKLKKKLKKEEKKKKKLQRMAGGQAWEDPSLEEWNPNDFRLFCGDLGNDVSDDVLTRAFNKYPSFLKAKVVREKRTNKSKGYGFVSFKDPQDFIRAMKDMNGKWFEYLLFLYYSLLYADFAY